MSCLEELLTGWNVDEGTQGHNYLKNLEQKLSRKKALKNN
jgi:hypothetical protein